LNLPWQVNHIQIQRGQRFIVPQPILYQRRKHRIQIQHQPLRRRIRLQHRRLPQIRHRCLPQIRRQHQHQHRRRHQHRHRPLRINKGLLIIVNYTSNKIAGKNQAICLWVGGFFYIICRLQALKCFFGSYKHKSAHSC
jgi:hypothetical protein